MASPTEGDGVERSGSRAECWRERIRACEASGLTIERYCRDHGLSASGYHGWKRELKRREAQAPLRGASVPVFAEVRVTPPQAHEAVALEVVLPLGGRVRVYPGFDEATLARVLAVVERSGC